MNSWDIELADRSTPLLMPWPTPGLPGGFIQFNHFSEWRDFLRGLDIDPRIPESARLKYARAQKLYFLGWLDGDLVKAGELAALIALELALSDRYGSRWRRKPSFNTMLDHMVRHDGLTDNAIPMVARTGGSVIGRVDGSVKPSLSEIRNSMAHGDPFDGFPHGGLLELVRDLINYAYRDYIANAGPIPGHAS